MRSSVDHGYAGIQKYSNEQSKRNDYKNYNKNV